MLDRADEMKTRLCSKLRCGRRCTVKKAGALTTNVYSRPQSKRSSVINRIVNVQPYVGLLHNGAGIRRDRRSRSVREVAGRYFHHSTCQMLTLSSFMVPSTEHGKLSNSSEAYFIVDVQTNVSPPRLPEETRLPVTVTLGISNC